MFFSPWVITIPGVALFALVLGDQPASATVFATSTAPESRS